MGLKDLIISQFSGASEVQQSAYNQLKDLEFPTFKDEEWKFTNVKSLIKNDYAVPSKVDFKAEDAQITLEGAINVYCVNGHCTKIEGEIDSNALEIGSFGNAVNENPDLLANLFNKIAYYQEDIFTLTNTALHQDGVYLKVKKGKTVEAPVVIHNIIDTKLPAFTNTRNLFIVEENAEASVVEYSYTKNGQQALQNKVEEIYVDTHGRLNYYKIQNDGESSSEINTTQVNLETKSFFAAHTFSFSGEIIRNNLNLRLNGEHIEAHMNGLYLLDEKTHVDNHTIADHRFPNCESHELYKGIMDDKSNGVFNGKIFVRKDAQKTNAFQSNNNILLSDSAKVNTKPQLEIWADDVSCSHGCTTGQLDQDALFYLNARGIGKRRATALLLEAFALEVVDRIKIEELREQVTAIISKRLEQV